MDSDSSAIDAPTGTRDDDAPPRESQQRSRGAQIRILGAGVVIAGFVATYIYNTVSWRDSLLRADQWYWVEFVLIPYQQGEMSLFEAVTFEYQVFSHGHIPTLITFLFSYEFLDLSLAPDRIVGVLAPGLILAIVFIYSRRFLQLDAALITTAIASSILFASASPEIFAWSLLQFQLFYLLVAVVYLASFVKWHDTHPVAHALVGVPAAVLLGDAMGVAAVVASLVYLAFLAATKRTKAGTLLVYYGLFPIQLLVLAAVFSGERNHDSSSWSGFADFVATQPTELLRGTYYSLASVFGALTFERPSRFLSWSSAPVWFVLTIAVAAVAVYLVVRTPLRRRDYFPILLVLTGCVWVGGVLKARAMSAGPEAMQAPRLGLYSALIGVGLLLLLVSKTVDRPGIRRPLLVLAALLVLANGVGSLQLSAHNQSWITLQDDLSQELRSFALGEVPEYTDGSRCGQRADCLEPTWFLYDMGLIPLDDEGTEDRRWPAELRGLVSAQLDELGPDERWELCVAAKVGHDQSVLDKAINDSPIDLESAFAEVGIETSHAARAGAERMAVQRIRLACGQPITPAG